MTAISSQAPELTVQTWFNTDRPMNLVGAARPSGGAGRLSGAVPQLDCLRHSAGAPDPRDVRAGDVAVSGCTRRSNIMRPITCSMLKAFIHEYRLKFPVALDSPNAAGPIPHTMDRYNMRGTPSLVLIDRQGLVRKHAFGASDDLRIGAEIGALTQEARPAAKPAQVSAA